MPEPPKAAVEAAQSFVRGILYNAGTSLDEHVTAVNIARAVLAAAHVEAEEGLRAVADQRDEAIHIAEARGVEKDRHRREKLAAEERVRVLTEALTTLLDGKAGQILGGYARATHPGRAYVELGHIYQEWWDEAQRDLNTARAALAVSSTENGGGE